MNRETLHDEFAAVEVHCQCTVKHCTFMMHDFTNLNKCLSTVTCSLERRSLHYEWSTTEINICFILMNVNIQVDDYEFLKILYLFVVLL